MAAEVRVLRKDEPLFSLATRKVVSISASAALGNKSGEWELWLFSMSVTCKCIKMELFFGPMLIEVNVLMVLQ